MELKQDRMTHFERMDALFHYQKPDRVPIFALGSAFYMINCGFTLTELQTDSQKAFNAISLRTMSLLNMWTRGSPPVSGDGLVGKRYE